MSAAARPILVDGDPRLLDVAAAVTSIDDAVRHDIAALCATLAEFRRAHGFGRAIAAPQIGIARRIIAVDLGAGPFVLVNPRITWRSDETFELWDDCFSVPDRLVRVRRHRSIDIDYLDAQARRRTWTRLPRELAELLQHEIDHLDGVLMTARACGDGAVQPATRRAQLVDGARAAHRLSLDAIRAAMDTIDPVFLQSPQYDCAPLSVALGRSVTLKLELCNPIRSFKGRGAEYFVSRLCGDRAPALPSRTVVCASAGNFGQAMAYACRRRGIALTVFAAHGANPLKLERMRALGADVRLHGDDFDAAKDAARAHADAHGAFMVEDGLQPAISEGAGTIAVELLRGDPAYAAVLVPLGNGALLTGVARWIKAASPSTQVIGVVARGAPAMADSWRRGPGADVVVHPATHTIADGIAVRVPIAEAVADMHGLVDAVLDVDDASLLQAMRLLHVHAGLVVEPAGAAGVAALLEHPDAIPSGNVATVICGGNVAEAQMREWL